MTQPERQPDEPAADAFWRGGPPPPVPAVDPEAPLVTLQGEGTLTADGRPLLDHLNMAYRIMQEQARKR
jgi:hypothetical protein